MCKLSFFLLSSITGRAEALLLVLSLSTKQLHYFYRYDILISNSLKRTVKKIFTNENRILIFLLVIEWGNNIPSLSQMTSSHSS